MWAERNKKNFFFKIKKIYQSVSFNFRHFWLLTKFKKAQRNIENQDSWSDLLLCSLLTTCRLEGHKANRMYIDHLGPARGPRGHLYHL